MLFGPRSARLHRATPTPLPRQGIALLASNLEAVGYPPIRAGAGFSRSGSGGRRQGIALFTHITLWARPYWDLLEYHVSLRYEGGDGAEPVHLVKEGTLDVGADRTPEEMLLHLARFLQVGQISPSLERDIHGR